MPRARGACALLLAAACASEPAEVAVVFHGGQPRRAPVMPCDGCMYYDVADAGLAPGRHAILVLDGHSNPPTTLVGLRLADFAAVVRAIDPVTLVGVTCRLGELRALERLFAAAPRLETIVASTVPLPWDGFAAVAACLSRHPQEPMLCVPKDMLTYRRADVLRLRELADDLLADIQACRAAPVLVAGRRYPPYLCVAVPGLPPVGRRLDYRELFQRCVDRPPFVAVDAPCAAGDDRPDGGPAAP